MDFIFKVDPIRRSIKVPDAFTVLTMDHNIHKLVFICPYYEDFAFDSASIVFMVDAPDGKQYIIPAEEYESFPNSPSPYVKFTLTLKSYITSVVGYMSFCITADIISSGNVIEKSWHSKNITISVGGHIDNDDSEDIPEEDVPTINQRLNNLDSKVGRLQTTVNGMANGSPAPVATVAEMTDESAVYLYTGSETGYTAGNWYFWNGSAWTSGGTYGGAVTDTTLSVSGKAADAKAVGDALADKADSSDVTALDTRVTAVEGDVESLAEDIAELQDGGYVADQQKITEKINGWLEEHPEATTTVEDGAVTEAKLSDALKIKTINGYVTPEMYGAKGDGQTDDSTAIQQMLDEAPLNSVCVFNNDYYCGTGLLVTRAINVIMYGKCIFPNTLEYGFRVYGHGAKRNTFRVNLECYGVQDTWTNRSIIGLDLWACQENTFDVYCQGFKTGIRLLAGNTTNEVDCDYNKIFIRTIYNCQYAIWMDGLTGESPLNGGTVSQNTFIGGRIGVQGSSYAWLGAEDTPDNCYWAVRSDLKASRTNNNNTFIAVSFEGFGAKASPYENRAKVTLDFAYCMYLNCRYENMTSFSKTVTGIVPSMVIGGYGAEDLYTDDIYHVGNRKTILRPYGSPVVIQRAGSGDRFLEVRNANNVLYAVLEGKNFYVPTLNLLPNGNPYGSVNPSTAIKLLLEYSYGNPTDTMSHIGNGEWRITNFGHIVSKKRDGSKTYDIQPIYTDVSGINPITGTMAFVNGKPQWYDGTQWVDATGQAVT